jgi:hypothetical protein
MIDSGGRGGLASAEGFRFVQPHVPKQPMILAVGPVTISRSMMDLFQTMGVLPPGEPKAGGKKFLTCMFAVGCEDDALRADIFVSSAMIEMLVKTITSGSIDLMKLAL